MELEIYKNYCYPAVLLDRSLRTAYKNPAARAAKLAPKIGRHISIYMDGANLKILNKIITGVAPAQVIELYGRRCFATAHGAHIALIFFDALDLLGGCGAETAGRINALAAKYHEFICAQDGARMANKKKQKIRAYFKMHAANIKLAAENAGAEKSYCDIWEFLEKFRDGAAPGIKKLGYKLDFKLEPASRLFMHKLNESDFLTLNFILISHALSRSLFGALELKFEPSAGALVYEFLPDPGHESPGGLDFELAELIAGNNNLKLEFCEFEGKSQILVRFTAPEGLAQAPAAGYAALGAGYIAGRARIELAILYNV